LRNGNLSKRRRSPVAVDFSLYGSTAFFLDEEGLWVKE
jgi:hypothetical protein